MDDAASPSNHLALNAEALKKAIETQGKSMTQGLPSSGTMCSGPSVANRRERLRGRPQRRYQRWPVVFENEFFQLLEYKPLTAKVHERPILLVPPCINKFYILDLQPENSLIRYTVAEGHRVFVVSWRTPATSMAHVPGTSISRRARSGYRVVQEISGQEQINTLGFCVGGTILSPALAVLASRGERPAATSTLLTTFLDFSDTGILDIFIDEGSVQIREMTIGAESAGGGSLLRGRSSRRP